LCNLKSVIAYHAKLPGKIVPVVNGQRHGSLLVLRILLDRGAYIC
jgi:hypothetical protein